MMEFTVLEFDWSLRFFHAPGGTGNPHARKFRIKRDFRWSWLPSQATLIWRWRNRV